MNEQNEIWKVIAEAPSYEVSSFGNVRHRVNKVNRRFAVSWNGYFTITLRFERTKKIFRIHTLVANAFLGQRPKGLVINHKNGIKTDNRSKNLEYVSYKENLEHAYQNGLRKYVTLTLRQQTLSIKEWSKLTGINYATIQSRLFQGYCTDCALTQARNVKCGHKGRAAQA